MTRPHSRGYIRQADYWNIGTDAQRGRDGMNAREAAQRYNDHRHPAFIAAEIDDVTSWRDAIQESSAVTVSGLSFPGGYEETDTSTPARQPGDMMFYLGAPFITDGSDVLGIGGFGGKFAIDGAFTPDSLVLTLAQHTTPIRIPAAGAVEAPLGIPDFGALLRPGDVRVASAARVTFELSGLASIEFSDAPDQALTSILQFAPYADVRLLSAPINSNSGITGPILSQICTFRAEAYSGAPGDGLLRNVGQATPGHRYEAETFTGEAGLYTLDYRFSNIGEAGIDAPTPQQTAAYAELLNGMTLVLHGLTLRMQLEWAV